MREFFSCKDSDVLNETNIFVNTKKVILLIGIKIDDNMYKVEIDWREKIS